MDEIPADCILIKTEDKDGKAFVKTSQLDGERNLKPKLAIQAVNGENFEEIFGQKDNGNMVSVNCIEPLRDLYSYNGNLIIKNGAEKEQRFPLGMDQFLHRGSFLENSGHVLALVIYTGTESKLVMNMGGYHLKRSRFERVLNLIQIMNLVFTFLFSGLGAYMNRRWLETHYCAPE